MGKIKALPGAFITALPLMTVIISAAVFSFSDMQRQQESTGSNYCLKKKDAEENKL